MARVPWRPITPVLALDGAIPHWTNTTDCLAGARIRHRRSRRRAAQALPTRQPSSPNRTCLTGYGSCRSCWTHRTRPQLLGNHRTVSTAPTALILFSQMVQGPPRPARRASPVDSALGPSAGWGCCRTGPAGVARSRSPQPATPSAPRISFLLPRPHVEKARPPHRLRRPALASWVAARHSAVVWLRARFTADRVSRDAEVAANETRAALGVGLTDPSMTARGWPATVRPALPAAPTPIDLFAAARAQRGG